MDFTNLPPDSKAFLAPMAGVADRAFREICRDFGAAYTVTEMVSSKGLVMGDRKSRELMTLGSDRPAAIQLFGTEPRVMAQAAKLCLEFEPQAIDINMGCPAPKVANNGAGSALMKDPQLAGEIIYAVPREPERLRLFLSCARAGTRRTPMWWSWPKLRSKTALPPWRYTAAQEKKCTAATQTGTVFAG